MDFKKIHDAIFFLNLYRNKHYNEQIGTIEQLMAKAIDNVLPYLVKKLSEDEKTTPVPSDSDDSR